MEKKLIILLLIITACNHDQVKPANSTMPDEMMMSDGMMMTPCSDLSWLMALENSIVQSNNKGEVYSYVYNNQMAYEIKPCVDCPDVVNTIDNCSGMAICQYANNMGTASCQEFLSVAMEKKLIWKN